jgi:hypothetical protein
MVQYRRSKKVGPFRVTASSRGVSYSVGAGPVRVTRRADGRVQQTTRYGGGFYDTKIVGGTKRPRQAVNTAEIRPSIPVQILKLVGILLLLGFILSVMTGSLAVGYGIVGGIAVVGLVILAVSLAVLVARRRQ